MFYEIPGFLYQTFLGLVLGKLFPARESLVSDIPAGDGNTAKPFLQSTNEKYLTLELYEVLCTPVQSLCCTEWGLIIIKSDCVYSTTTRK